VHKGQLHAAEARALGCTDADFFERNARAPGTLGAGRTRCTGRARRSRGTRGADRALGTNRALRTWRTLRSCHTPLNSDFILLAGFVSGPKAGETPFVLVLIEPHAREKDALPGRNLR